MYLLISFRGESVKYIYSAELTATPLPFGRSVKQGGLTINHYLVALRGE